MATSEVPPQQLAGEALRKWETGDRRGAFEVVTTALPVGSAAAAPAVLGEQERQHGAEEAR